MLMQAGRSYGFMGGRSPEDQQKLYEDYLKRLVNLARLRLRRVPQSEVDGEDVAVSALASFFKGVEHGRFPRLRDPDDLWKILVCITVRKAIDYRKRSGRHPTTGWGIEEIIGREPTPELTAMVADQLQQFLDVLDKDLRQVAIWKLEGYTNAEIAKKRGRCVRTIERDLELNRRIWKEKFPGLF
jgi:DNA-directed RNA polymerase specialized sigma24 family protein